MDETNALIRRNGMATAVGTRILAQSLYQLANLIEMANQPLPSPQAPLVGDLPQETESYAQFNARG